MDGEPQHLQVPGEGEALPFLPLLLSPKPDERPGLKGQAAPRSGWGSPWSSPCLHQAGSKSQGCPQGLGGRLGVSVPGDQGHAACPGMDPAQPCSVGSPAPLTACLA